MTKNIRLSVFCLLVFEMAYAAPTHELIHPFTTTIGGQTITLSVGTQVQTMSEEGKSLIVRHDLPNGSTSIFPVPKEYLKALEVPKKSAQLMPGISPSPGPLMKKSPPPQESATGSAGSLHAAAPASESHGLVSKPTAFNLNVEKAWIAPAQTPKNAKGGVKFDGQSGLWVEGRLLFVDSEDRKLWSIEPATFKTDLLLGSDSPASVREGNRLMGGMSNFDLRNKRPAFAKGNLFLPEQGDVWVYQIRDSRWHPLHLPDANYSLWLANGGLYASFGDRQREEETPRGEGAGLYRIDPSIGTAELIFHTKRRPALHPLDKVECERPFCVIPGPEGVPIVGLVGKPNRFCRISDGAETEVVNRRLLSGLTCMEGEALFVNTAYQVEGRNFVRGIQRVRSDGHMETLIWNPQSGFPVPSEPVWPFPEDLLPLPDEKSDKHFVAAMRQDDLCLLAWERGASTWGASVADLYIFTRGKAAPVRISLTFVLSAADEKTVQETTHSLQGFLYPMIRAYELLPLEDGIAVSGLAMPGFWFIPEKNLRKLQ